MTTTDEEWSWALPGVDGRPQDSAASGSAPFSVGPGWNFGDGLSWRSRVAAVLAVLLVLVLALLAYALGMDGLRATCVSLFLLLGTGVGPTLLLRRVSPLWFGVLALTSSLTAALGIGMLMAATHEWHPRVAFGVVLVASLAILALVAARLVVERPDNQLLAGMSLRGGWNRQRLMVPALTGAGLLVAAVTAAVQPMSPAPNGLWLRLGPVWWVGLALLLAALVLAVRRQVSPAAPVLALCTVVILSQALSYGEPTVMSAARHVGVVEYIRANGGVDRAKDIFQAWSGLFSGIAYVGDAAGVRDVMAVATWWPVVLSPLLAAATAALASRWLHDQVRPWLAGGVFVLSATLNIVYFSPQSFGLLSGLVILGVVTSTVPEDHRVRTTPSPAQPPPAVEARGRWVVLRRTAFLLVFASVMAVTHQISPYLTVSAVVVLTVFGYVRPWWTFVLVLVPAVGWALMNTGVLGGFVSVEAIGRLWNNIQPPNHSFAQYPEPTITRLAFDIPALALLAVGLLALLRLVTARRRSFFALAVAGASPLGLLVATDYGSEGIFRATLFAGPWLAILAMSFDWRGGRLGRVVLPITLVALFMANAFGQTALDWNRVVRRDAAAATAMYEQQAPTSSLLLLTGTTNATPLSIGARYLDVNYVSRELIGGYPAPSSSYDADADVRTLTTKLEKIRPATGYYALVSDSIGAYDERYGFQPYADYEQLAAAMSRSTQWEPIFSGPTTTLYHLRTATK